MNEFKKVIYNIRRSYIKKSLTGFLGKVVEDNEKVICYVEKHNIEFEKYNSTIACFGIREEQKEIAKVYKLNKPICYVIDGLQFKNHRVNIFGYNDCEVIIKNCNFEFDLYIHVDGKCTLDNTDIRTLSSLMISANELVIQNMSGDQIKIIGPKSDIGFGANDKIDVIDSNIGNKKKKINVSFLATNELNIVNSNIYGKDVVLESSVINVDEKSSLTATGKVTLKTDDFSPMNLNAPIIVLNEEEIANEKKSVVFTKITDPLILKRVELVKLLRKVKNECESINLENVSKYQEELSNHAISKVLKR